MKAGKPKKKKKYIKVGWDDLFKGEIVIIGPPKGAKEKEKPKKDRRVGLAPGWEDDDSGTAVADAGTDDWPGIDGVNCTFVPSGSNYGNIGDLSITNDTDQPVTVTVPPGLLLDSSDLAVQDLYVADVPTETPCSGAKDVGKPITIDRDSTHVIKDVPGFCPDFEKNPPQKGDEDVYTCKQPDEKSEVLLNAIELVKKLDVGSLKLDVFGKDKAEAMVAQGSLWVVDSKIDDVKGNEIDGDDLSSRFFGTFATAAKDALDGMSPETREKAEKLVKDDIKKIVDATSFVTKKSYSVPRKKKPKRKNRGNPYDNMIAKKKEYEKEARRAKKEQRAQKRDPGNGDSKGKKKKKKKK